MAYNVAFPVKIFDAVSLAADATSPAFYVQNQDNVAFQLAWTGTPVGSFSVQVSLDHKQDINNNILVAGTWFDLPLSVSIVASGSADSAYIDLNQLSAPYVRVKYTRTSGTGALTGYATAKGV